MADFYDPDIEAKLAALEAEELQLSAEFEAEQKPEEDADYDAWLQKTYQLIQDKTAMLRNERILGKETNHPTVGRKETGIKLDQMVKEMSDLGLEVEEVEKKSAKRSRSRLAERIGESEELQKELERAKTHSRKPQKDIRDLDEGLRKRARAASQLSQRRMKLTGQKGEGDRFNKASLEKHLYAGKRTNGTHRSR